MKLLRNIIVGGGIVCAGVFAGPGFAQEFSAVQALAFLDKDGDSKISLDEYLAFQAPKLAEFDADQSGVLSLKEFRGSLSDAAKKTAERSYEAFNQEENRRGLTQREFLGYHAYVFKNMIDRNRDGFLSADDQR